MRKTVKFPAPELSQLKEVNINLDMSGRHYAQLATSEGQIPEDVVLSILKDLMEEDANKLTYAEMRYLFMLVKINSLENDYVATVSCTHTKENGEPCGALNEVKIKLSDADLNPTPKGYKVPKITFATKECEKEYLVMPPTMDMICGLYNWFMTVKGKSVEDMADDKKTATDFSFIYGCLHLTDPKTNERLVKEFNDFEWVLEFFDTNKYQTVRKLLEYVDEVSKYGVQNKTYEIECKECGGKLIFRLPLLHGTTD